MSKQISRLAFLLIFIFLGFFEFASAATHQYQITANHDLTKLTVNACFDGKAPNYLAVESKIGISDLVDLPHSSQGSIEIQGRYWKTKNLADNACIDYRVSLKRYLAKRTRESRKRKNILFIEDNTWLWLPRQHNPNDNIELKFILPSWANISAPWQQKDVSEKRFLLGNQPQEWGYFLMIGDFDMGYYPVSEQSYLSVASFKNMKNKEDIHRWIQDTGASLKAYLGEYPVKHTQVILVQKTKTKHGPVPWGQLKRGNGMGILFVIIPKLPIEKFYADWTATHEFSHMLLPNINWEDKWLSEGLASYLEYVLMAQSKSITKEEAWLGIINGLKRGEKGTNNLVNETLAETVQKRGKNHRTGRTMRIYWSGALYFLKADLALRKQSKGKIGLNDILLKLNWCCVNHTHKWSGKKLTGKLDKLSNSRIFSQLFNEFTNGTVFPDYTESLSQLGVLNNATSSQKVELLPGSFSHEIMISR